MIRGIFGSGGGVCQYVMRRTVSVGQREQRIALKRRRTIRKPHCVQTWKFQSRQV